ncbi:Mnd1 [Acrasis kona]|uniref:Mnd1 n=1 Tax=Acrasis kona TaxID=1008807 RepID=A0AAW2Z5C1_9EUKA
MSKKKTTSHDEKMDIVCDFFIEQREPFTLKECEKAIPKAKPQIKFPVVKEVIQALIGDNRIETDKIGLANYFWLYPSAAANKAKRKYEELEKEVEDQNSKKQKLEEEIEQALSEKEDTEERRNDLSTYEKLQATNKTQDQQLQKFADNDPVLVKKIEEDAIVAKESANRWTEVIFNLQSFLRNNTGLSTSDFCKQFEVPEDLDELE